VALAGCADVPVDTNAKDGSVTSPMSLAGQMGSRASVGTIQNASLGASAGSTSVFDATTDIAAPGLASKATVDLRITNPEVTVNANEPIKMGFSLTDEKTHKPLADQLIKVQVKMPAGWMTFKHLQTDAQGFASYTAKVLTTTQITAVFDGTDGLRSTRSDNIGTLNVRVQPPPIPRIPTPRVNTPQVSVSLPGSSLGAKAVYLASQYAGRPYVYGAEGPNAFDCSGFSQYVFKQLGRTLPRTTNEQYAAVNHVSQYNKQIGDLIFIGTPGNITHMGIYAGDGRMWAAPHTGDVVRLQTIYSTTYLVGRVL
jgi:cell wall-associated NlpC family hydrolase